ncbi:MAG: hypothetical protein JO064_11055 [Actinobacteria bacterium]|nr:hypothetical protein [Actinomycetota bacterium]
MKAPPVLRGGFAARLALLGGGVTLFGAGIVLMLESKLGLAPWDVLNQGLSRHSPLSFGEANLVISLAIVVLAWRLGAPIGVGTITNAVGISVTIIVLTAIHAVGRLAHEPLAVRIVLLAAGISLIGAGSGFYLGAALGAGPRDSLMVVGARRTRFRIGAVRATLELVALLAGLALGGTAGAGTVAFVVLIGPSVEGSFWLLSRSPLALPSTA